MMQLTLELEPAKLRTGDLILAMLKDGNWWAPWEICRKLEFVHGRKISDANATARLREMRLPRFGGHNIVSRPRTGSTGWEYKITGRQL